MGQIPVEQWAPPWGPFKVYDGKDNLEIDCTMLNSCLENTGTYSYKANELDPKIALTNPVVCNNPTINSNEKSGFEPDIVITPPNSILLSSSKLSNTGHESNNEYDTCTQEPQLTGTQSGCIIKEEPIVDQSVGV